MKPRILVVDDEESIREFLDIMLRKEGYEVTCVADGKLAIEMLKKKSIDMVISDLQMPNVTGIELLKHVRENYPDLLFMMITAFGTAETAVEAMKMGAYDYLTKPFKLDEVRINIANALRSKSLEVENRTLKKELEAKGIAILSPRFEEPKNPGEEFVVFSGEEGISPLQLERHHLNSITKSDALMVCDPQGYVGASALIEIGFAHALNKRVIYTEKPQEFMLNTLPGETGREACRLQIQYLPVQLN
jgi:CheY-like chemotaxis protein